MKAIKPIAIIALSIISIVLLITKFDYDNTKAFEYIITFLSIAAGFNITALSIIANSQFAGKLYNIEDATDNSKTLLHVLVNKFKSSIGIFLFTIALVLFYFFIEGDSKDVTAHTQHVIFSYTITFPKVIKALIWFLTIVSSIKFNELIVTFSKVVIKSTPKS